MSSMQQHGLFWVCFMCREQTSEQLWHEHSETSSPFRKMSTVSLLSVCLFNTIKAYATSPQVWRNTTTHCSSVWVRYSASSSCGCDTDSRADKSFTRRKRKRKRFLWKKKKLLMSHRARGKRKGSQKNIRTILKPVWGFNYSILSLLRWRALRERMN